MLDDPIANVAKGWKRAASSAMAPTPFSGMSAALWAEPGGGLQEVSARPNSDVHSLSFTEDRFDAEAVVDGKPIFAGTAPAGACNIVQPGQAPRGVFRGPWRLLHVYVPDAFLRGLVEQEDLGAPTGAFELVNPRWTVQPRLRWIARNVRLELEAGSPFGRLRLDALGFELAVELLRTHSTLGRRGPAASAGSGGLAPWQLKRACQAMEAQLHGEVGLDALAQVAGCSPAHFSRAFKQSTGLPPFAWLLERRMERAKELLLADPSMSLAEVALAVGFSAQPQFTTAFRRMTGTTPGAWRRDRSS